MNVIYNSLACMLYMCHVRIWCWQRTEESVRPPGTGVIWRCLELSPSCNIHFVGSKEGLVSSVSVVVHLTECCL